MRMISEESRESFPSDLASLDRSWTCPQHAPHSLGEPERVFRPGQVDRSATRPPLSWGTQQSTDRRDRSSDAKLFREICVSVLNTRFNRCEEYPGDFWIVVVSDYRNRTNIQKHVIHELGLSKAVRGQLIWSLRVSRRACRSAAGRDDCRRPCASSSASRGPWCSSCG